MWLRKSLIFTAFVLFVLVVSACTAGKPAIMISSPPSGSTYHEGDDIAIQSTSADQAGVVRVELTVDGAVVRNDTPPSPQPNFFIVQTWKATQGPHTIIVRAYNAAGASSDPAAISVQVSPSSTQNNSSSSSTSSSASSPTPTNTLPAAPSAPSPTSTTGAPPATCTNNAAFVTDVTIPDGASIAAGTPFVKTWRFSNNGTCVWGGGYQLIFIGGEAMTSSTVVAVPVKNPGETADISVSMTAPATGGNHTGIWKMRSASGVTFGQAVTVKIVVPGPPPPPPQQGCSGQPVISNFFAYGPTFAKGTSVTITSGATINLSWGEVTNADSVEIDHGIGGVPTPGTATDAPTSSTTYTLTAHCGSNTATAQVTVNVQGLPPPAMALPDLYVSEFSLNPNPPHKSGATLVRVGVYNQGNAASGAFKVQWYAGSNYPAAACNWNVGPLPAHGGQILTCNAPANTWGSWYGSITTRVKVDYENSVPESDETNNIYDQNISVSP